MIVVDVETGGIDPLKNPLLSIGAVEFENPTNQFYSEIAPLRELEITEEALKVNGINVEEWKEKEHLGGAMASFHTWVYEVKLHDVLGGHNPQFDLGFLNVNIRRCAHELPFSYRTVDLHSIAYSHFYMDPTMKDDEKNHLTSNEIYKRLNMKTEPKPHNALNGAKYETEALYKLILGHGCDII